MISEIPITEEIVVITEPVHGCNQVVGCDVF